MKKTLVITALSALLIITALIIFNKASSRKDIVNLFADAKRGQFDIIVTTTGELQAENSIDIRGPEFTMARNIRIMDIKILDLVPEGTEVNKGDFIASLDKTTFDNTLKDEMEKLVIAETNLEMKILDTALTLSGLRDNIKNLKYTVQESEITLQQSKYEPPTTIRQAEIALDKAIRSLDQAIKSYSLKVEQAKSELRSSKYNLREQQKRVSDLQTLLSKFIITAPSPGMVIYKRDRSGAKRKIGSTISPWDNVVATLPDMSSMLSKTYVNEIDVSKVKVGQPVEINVDAFPEKSYGGVIISVANIGEQLPNADAKVFEVLIKVDVSDPILRPSMTTGNKIITKTIRDVIYIPLECVQTGADSIPYVYLRNGHKQIVVLGESNENNVIIEQGIKEGVQIFLNTPENADKFKRTGEEFISIINEREKARKEEEMRIRQEAGQARKNREEMMNAGPGRNYPSGMMQQFNGTGGSNQEKKGTKDTSALNQDKRKNYHGRNGSIDTTAKRNTKVIPGPNVK